MKNKKFLITITLLISATLLIFVSCSFLPNMISNICIYDCKHGKIEVRCISETIETNEFLVTGYPDAGYCLLEKNVYIYDYNNKQQIHATTLSDQKNAFKFSATYNTNITISAFFTKVTQE